MVIAVNHALAEMKHALGGGDVAIEIDKRGLLNQAGHFLVNMHSWRWLTGRSKLIDLRGAVDDTTATWTASTLTLTETGGFTNYIHVEGDQVEIESGTGATTGFFEVASRTDSDNIVLSSSLAVGNLVTGDIVWNIQTNSASLPDDFRDIIDISATDSLLYGVRMTSLAQILANRTSQIQVTTSWNYQAAVAYSGSPPVPILEIWPNPDANQSGVFSIFYRSGWTRVTTDTQVIAVPEFMDSLYLRIARAFALGVEREAVATMSQRLAEIQQGPEFIMAAKRDGNTQPYYQRLRGGGAAIHSRHFGANKFAYVANTIGAPSA